MIRGRAAVAAALALAALACGKTASNAPGVRLRQPSSVAVFRGRTLADPNVTKPYLVVANQARNDLTILDATTDGPVAAPLKLRALVLPVQPRPSLVAAASLGDDADPADPKTGKPDVLVAVAGGDSVLQLVETWNILNEVHADGPLAVDLGHDVLAVAAIPSPAGTARFAAVLADQRVAVVTYARGADGLSIAPVLPVPPPLALPFQPVAITAMPGDAAATALYVASIDPVCVPGAPDATGAPTCASTPIPGVAELPVSLDAAGVRARGARAPTRLVAAARVKERLPASAANDQSAFSTTEAPRVYAVLDESGCGLAKPIDCGVVTLDPGAASGTVAIPRDDQFMPYRAPVRVPGRAVQLAVSGPPLNAPPVVGTDNLDFAADALKGFMRLYTQGVARATPAVAAVASDDGHMYYLDLGRNEIATITLDVANKFVDSTVPGFTRPCGTTTTKCGRRLRIVAGPRSPATAPYAVGTTGDSGVPAAVTVTPGYTPDQTWTIEYQGFVASPELYQRMGEAGESAPGTPWVALQVGVGGGTFNQVARIWDPRLGVHPGDILVIKAGAVGAPCVGTAPAVSTDTNKEFEVGVVDLLAPSAAYPGGAATIQAREGTDQPTTDAWRTCFDALVAKASGASVATGLVVSVRAGGYVMRGVTASTANLTVNTGYMGRPEPSPATFTLQYEDEDALAASCPLEAWDGTPATAPGCDATCRATCEKLAIVRKVRRYLGLSVDCNTDPKITTACVAAWQDNASTTPPGPFPQTDPVTTMTPAFPLVYSPVVLQFAFAVEPEPENVDTTPTRGMTLVVKTTNVFLFQGIGKSTSPYQASGITTFDRSAWATDPTGGYRFLVSYPADFVLDTSPSLGTADPVVIR